MTFLASIYRLQHEDGHFYIGSSCDMKSRIKNHKISSKTKNTPFYKYVRENGGWEKIQIQIIQQWECKTIFEMYEEEGKYLDEQKNNSNSLNRQTAGKTPRSSIGIIYKLTVANKFIYFGRCRDFIRRKAGHKTQSKISESKLYKTIRENGGWDCVQDEIIKSWECDDNELKICEDEFIRANWQNEFILNSMAASSTPEQKKELSKARFVRWREAHSEEAKEQDRIKSKRWRENNPEKAREAQRKNNEKRKTDPERIQYQKEWYAIHRDERNAKRRERRKLQKELIEQSQ